MPPSRKRVTKHADTPANKVAKVTEPTTVVSGGSKTQSQLSAFRRTGKLCDIVVRVGAREFPAHRVVLAAGSCWFAALTDGGRFADSQAPTVDLHDMSAEAFEAVLDYLYEGSTCTTAPLADVGAAAAFLQVTPLLERIGDAMASALRADNCVATWLFATNYALDGLLASCRETAVQFFPELGSSAAALPPHEMRALLAMDELEVEDEKIVYDAAVNYARLNDMTDDDTLADFLAPVRYPLLTAANFAAVMAEPLLRGAACREMLLYAFAAHVQCRHVVHRRPKPTVLKLRGMSAAEVKVRLSRQATDAQRARAGIDVFALCKEITRDDLQKEGGLCVCDDGNYGILYAKDRDDAGPWYVILDGADSPTDAYFESTTAAVQLNYRRVRHLEWA